MKSKFKFVGGVCAFVLGAFILQTSAQAQVSVSANSYRYDNNLNYLMGIVRLPNSNINSNTNTNTVNTTFVTQPATNAVINPVIIVTPVVVCPVYLNTFHKYGDRGSDVAKLQIFLNEYNGAKLNGQGFYGIATMQEVKNLQYSYGVKTTGAQYEKTTALINSLKCGNIPKKDRVVFTGRNLSLVSTTLKNSNTVITNIYPNSGLSNPANAVVKNYPTTKNTPKGVLTGVPTGGEVKATTTNSFFDNFKKDWNKIKENYKAYVLVFLLVLALFWFLRKAATE